MTTKAQKLVIQADVNNGKVELDTVKYDILGSIPLRFPNLKTGLIDIARETDVKNPLLVNPTSSLNPYDAPTIPAPPTAYGVAPTDVSATAATESVVESATDAATTDAAESATESVVESAPAAATESVVESATSEPADVAATTDAATESVVESATSEPAVAATADVSDVAATESVGESAPAAAAADAAATESVVEPATGEPAAAATGNTGNGTRTASTSANRKPLVETVATAVGQAAKAAEGALRFIPRGGYTQSVNENGMRGSPSSKSSATGGNIDAPTDDTTTDANVNDNQPRRSAVGDATSAFLQTMGNVATAFAGGKTRNIRMGARKTRRANKNRKTHRRRNHKKRAHTSKR